MGQEAGFGGQADHSQMEQRMSNWQEAPPKLLLNILLGVCVFYLPFLNLFYIFSIFIFSPASTEIAVS